MSLSKNKIIFLSLVIILLISSLYVYLIQGIFILNSTSSISRDIPELDGHIYIGNTVEWTGVLEPKIIDIELMNKDGKTLDLQEYPIEILLEETEHIGVVTEKDISRLNLQLASPNNYTIKDKDINIVIKLEPTVDQALLEELDRIKINYSLLGRANFQTVSISFIE